MSRLIRSVLVLSTVVLLFTGAVAAEGLGPGEIEFLNGLIETFETFSSDLRTLING